jgi:hydroxymethylglutaryl-CoA lyase
MSKIKIIECPRDAMQGIKPFIPTERKVDYIQSLLRVGFDTIDFGSFVSPKAIPQMVDTAEVLSRLDLSQTTSKLLAIIANTQGAEMASLHKEIQYLGFPFSISENFQMRNTHKTISESLITLQEILNIADKTNKEVVTYISMGFGNPYGDEYNTEMAIYWAEKIGSLGIRTISLADTTGQATIENIQKLFGNLVNHLPHIEFGAHFHAKPFDWEDKITAAIENGCKRFDGAILGFGGCPFAKDELVGNIPTEQLLKYLSVNNHVTDKYLISNNLINEALNAYQGI